MKIKIENQSSATHPYPLEKQTEVVHQGRTYIQVGESYKNLSYPKNLLRVIKLVGRVFLGILLLGVPFAFHCYRNTISMLATEIKDKREVTTHCVLPAAAPVGKLRFMKTMADQMQEKVRSLDLAQLHAANCYLVIGFERNFKIQQEFIITKPDHSPLNHPDFLQSIEKMNQKAKDAMIADPGAFLKYYWLILFKGESARGTRFVEIHGNCSDSGLSGGGTSSGKTALQFVSYHVEQDMDFPKKEIAIREGNFVPGPFYQNLDD
jgi:hypothetical protein